MEEAKGITLQFQQRGLKFVLVSSFTWAGGEYLFLSLTDNSEHQNSVPKKNLEMP